MDKLPEDVNSFFEGLARDVYKSNNLLVGLKAIREGKKYTGNNPGAVLMNIKTMDFLCIVIAHAGVVKEMRINERVISKSNPLMANAKDLWKDEWTKFDIYNSKRNPAVDFEMPKTTKKEYQNAINNLNK